MSLDALVRRIAAAPDRAGARQVVARARVPKTVALVERLADAVTSLTRVDIPQADRVSESALAVAEIVGDAYAMGRALRARGHVLAISAESQDAFSHYEAAIEQFTRSGHALEAAITRSGALQVLIYLGRYDQAFAWADAARATFRREHDDLRLARLDTNVANVLHRQDRFAEAHRLYSRAYRILARAGSPQDVGIALRNIAVCEISLNEFDAALRTHRRAKRISERHHLPLLAVQADYNIAYLYHLRGEYGRALELYDVARRRSERLNDRPRLGLCDLDQAELSLELNLTDDAVALSARAVARFTDLGMAYEAAKALVFGAIARAQHGDVPGALAQFRKARRMFRAERNRPWLALIDLYMALVLVDTDEGTRPAALARAALDAFSRHGLDAKAAMAHLVLARVALREGHLDAARYQCEAAAGRLVHTQARALRFQTAFVLGQVLEARGEPDAAAQAFLDAEDHLETLRSDLRGEETKIAFLKDKSVVYEHVVALAFSGSARVSTAHAFATAERAKSRSLSDLIALRARVAPRAPRSAGAARRLHRLRESLNWCDRERESLELSPDGRRTERLDALRARAQVLETSLAKVVGQIGVADREYASLFSGGTVGLPDVQATIPAGSVLLEYYEAKDQLYVFVVGRQQFDAVPLGPMLPVRERARLFQFQISKFRMGAAHTALFGETLLAATMAHLEALHRLLIAPIARLVEGRRLTIVPHGPLHHLPFHALYDGQAYLCDRAPVTYAPSASIHHLCRSKPAAGKGGHLVLGVPDAAAPYIADEIDAVAGTLSRARVLRGRSANAARLRKDGPSSRIIHIAAHGHFRGDHPMLSSIQLADGHLSLTDLYALRLRADLVTLSGCSTGMNALVAADELLGLVRGCLYAGARSVMVSLWDVHDRSTAELMGNFYRVLAATGDKAEALRTAMARVRDVYPHPYYWAPFVLVGSA